MRLTMMVGTMIAVGSLAATAVRAQESNAGTGAAATGRSAQSGSVPYGAYVNGPSTVDAQGNPVAKPNPMSRFLDRARELGGSPVEMPLVDDFRTDGTGTDGQYK